MRIPRVALRFSALLGVLLASGCLFAPRGLPASAGVPNFGRVNATLFRGAQPDAAGLAHLRDLGVRTIINFRQPSDTWPDEASSAHALALGYVSMPLPALRAPTDAQVARILALIAASPPPVFIHCEHGADRTGTLVACYRMQHDGWTFDRAFAEAKLYGFSPFQIGMRHYLRSFQPAASP